MSVNPIHTVQLRLPKNEQKEMIKLAKKMIKLAKYHKLGGGVPYFPVFGFESILLVEMMHIALEESI